MKLKEGQKSISLGAGHKLTVRLMLHEAQQLSGSDWVVTLLVEGWSLNEVYYSKQILEKFAKLIEALPGGKVPIRAFFLGGKFDHLPPEVEEEVPGPAGNVVGFANEPAVVDVDNRAALRAHVHIFESAKWMRDLLREAFDQDASKMLGLSLDAEGIIREGTAEGRSGAIADDITKLVSWEIVTDPAAGGGFDKIAASNNGGANKMKRLTRLLMAIARKLEIEGSDDAKAMAEAIVGHERVVPGSVLKDKLESILDVLTESESDERATKLDELIASFELAHVIEGISDDEDEDEEKADEKKAEDEKKEDVEDEKKVEESTDPVAAAEAVIAEFEKKLDAMQKKVDSAEEKAAVVESKAFVSAIVNGTDLPDAVKGKLLAEMDGVVLTESQVKGKIRAEREMLGKLADDGHVVDLGISKADQLRESRDVVDKRMLALDLGFGYKPEEGEEKLYEGIRPQRSIRDVYVWFTGDEDIDGVINPMKAHGGQRLTEAITTSTFTYALGTSMNKIMQQEYRAYESPWRQFSIVDRAENFKSHELIQWGSLGDIATVAEGATYLELTVAADFEATFTPTKRGGIVSITRETIINDDMRFLARVPRMVARSANRVLEQFVYNLLLNYSTAINDGTIYTGGALYTAGQSNLITDALDSDSLEAAQRALWNMTDSGSSEVLGLSPGYLVVPRELRQVAMRLQNDDKVPEGAENASNTLKGSLAGVIVSSKLQGDANNWYLTANPREIDTLTVGFINGQEAPTLILQNAENVGTVFTHDKITHKVRHEYGGAVNDFRAFIGGIVA
jgi:hypothetical protein